MFNPTAMQAELEKQASAALDLSNTMGKKPSPLATSLTNLSVGKYRSHTDIATTTKTVYHFVGAESGFSGDLTEKLVGKDTISTTEEKLD